MSFKECDPDVDPTERKLAIPVDELDKSNFWPEAFESGQPFVAPTSCRERAGRVQSHNGEHKRLGFSWTSVNGPGICIHDIGDLFSDRRQAGNEPLTLVSPDHDSA